MEESYKYLKHFSHEHPLEHVVSSHFGENCVCSACKLTINPNNSFYQCKICRFFLHKVCYTMPKKAMHPADPNHYLNLITSSLTDQLTECEACGIHIAGFYYNCTKCSVYYHMLCVAMPLSVKIPSSHHHILKLEMKPPYDFQCDLCERPSYSGWLYRCRLCEFDAHVSCAVAFRGTQSPYQRICCSEDERTRGSKSHQHEVMELLSEAMKGVKNVNILDRDQLQPLDQSTSDFTLPSYHFSDACFSIDIANSTPIEKNKTVIDSTRTKEQLTKRQSFDFGKKDLKRVRSLAPSTPISCHIRKELGLEVKNGDVNATDDWMQLKDQTTGRENIRRPFWSKLLKCV